MEAITAWVELRDSAIIVSLPAIDVPEVLAVEVALLQALVVTEGRALVAGPFVSSRRFPRTYGIVLCVGVEEAARAGAARAMTERLERMGYGIGAPSARATVGDLAA